MTFLAFDSASSFRLIKIVVKKIELKIAVIKSVIGLISLNSSAMPFV